MILFSGGNLNGSPVKEVEVVWACDAKTGGLSVSCRKGGWKWKYTREKLVRQGLRESKG